MEALPVIVAFVVGLLLGIGVGGALSAPRIAEAKLDGFTQAISGFAEFVQQSQREQAISALENATKGKKAN